MTVSTTTNRVSYAGNGSTQIFAVPFIFFDEADLVVIETVDSTGVSTTKTLTTHYTTSGGDGEDGSVTMLTAPASGTTLTILREPTRTQTLDLVENDPLPAEDLETALDKVTTITQRNRDLINRSIRQPDGDTADIGALPSKVDRASKYMGFDVDGDPVALDGSADATPISTFMADVVSAANAAAAQEAFGVRKRLSTTLTLYVDNVNGADTNDGLTEDTAFATIQKAVNEICTNYVLGNHAVTVQLVDSGTDYDEAVSLRSYVGTVNVDPASFTAPVIQGDEAASTNIVVAPSSGTAFTAVSVETPWCIANMKVAPTNGHAILADWGSVIYHRGMNFGACPNGSHIIAEWGSRVEALRGGYMISGGAQVHAFATLNSIVLAQSNTNTVTLSGTPAFSTAFAAAQVHSIVHYSEATFSGSATGKTSVFDESSHIYGPTATSIGMGIPGDTAGIFQASGSNIERRAKVGDADYAINSYDRDVAATVDLTAARTWTLPAAEDVPVGDIIYLLDGGAISGSFTISVACASGDQYTDGTTSFTLSSQGDCAAVKCAGPGFWYRLF